MNPITSFPWVVRLPEWARPDPSVLRYVTRERWHTWLVKTILYTTRFGVLGGLAVGSIIGARELVLDDNTGVQIPGPNVFMLVYIALAIMQFTTFIGALLRASEQLTDEQHRGGWELVKTTPAGVETMVRALWVGVFVQNRWMLITLLIPRLIFSAASVVDLSSVEGFHLGARLDGVAPDVPPFVALLLIGIAMLGALVEPVTMLGASAALGLFTSALVRERWVLGLVRFTIFAGAGLCSCWTLVSVSTIEEYGVPMEWRLFSLILATLGGDHGLWVVNIRLADDVWHRVDYSIAIGIVLLAVIALEAGLTRWLLHQAAVLAGAPRAK